jgi:ABC-2 type transport system ATP-binding protein
MERSPIIEARGLSKTFGTTVAVDAVDLALGPGEIVGLVGVNGAGKTTLLRMLAGITRPTRGEGRICGWSVEPDVVEGRRRLAFAGDDPAVFSLLTVWEHLRFVAELYRVPDWRARAETVLASFDMTLRRDAVVGRLSLGLQQRTALCCAFLHEPRAFLLDEPLNGLDPPSRKRLFDALDRAAATGAAVLLSSHQLELVDRACTRLVLLHDGRVRWDGSMAEARAAGDGGLEGLFLRVTANGSAA